ncbi:exonuclease domain-containing protein [Corynebacterium sp. ES2794-CONJ1]|uniref:exonuclease domain-containing protein n=1 Tax=unclassified Corynebacterium TaxID=2624378 RepID=UPI0021672E1B|nr:MULTISPECIES: exonuclease domain-containing protein [unclassified Corynebacterium]MCS4489770.1 exonuclease domain-containing protein [Corynebacterium sp. ES2775-CONJ]MCS4491866.1 exonuclease domain-containing protein [Corynebacterium sp. ES2715-CONJ3]MCS4531971.1 exonuclease domain-containing protein [Corynebacterium sp. ES2730-CONJ]MCU9519372.1 exonuclease domain-containing protein [Corynebacterium sp. ES2794-CONJ1]
MFRFLKRPQITAEYQAFLDSGIPSLDAQLAELKLLAVDMETTGLNPHTDNILAIGWVAVNGPTIDMSSAGYELVRGHLVGSSATIHHLTDDEVAHGLNEPDAIRRLVFAMHGRLMLNHFTALETQFLNRATKKYFAASFSFDTVDTFQIERGHMERMGTYPRGEDLRLAVVRRRYGLPDYGNHNALTDALACAELFLAQQAHLPAATAKGLMG